MRPMESQQRCIEQGRMHTHTASNETLSGRRTINPGDLHRARRETVAMLDTATDELAFYGLTVA